MKKHLLAICILGTLAFGAVSCSDDDNHVHQENKLEKFKGTWVGTYSGGDSGIIEFSIKDDGTIIGTIESDKFPESDLSLKGKVTIEGQVNIRLMYIDEVDIGGFIGTMTESTASGTWNNTSAGNITGTGTAGK